MATPITTDSTGSQLGDITLDNSVGTLSWSSSNTLTLNAANNIFLNANVAASNGSLALVAGGGSISLGANIETDSSQNYNSALTLLSDATLAVSGNNSSININAGITNSASKSLTLVGMVIQIHLF